MWRWCVSRSWRRCLGGLKTGPPRRHRIQPVEASVLVHPAKETCLKKRSESGSPWNQKLFPLEGPVLASSLWQICWNVYFKLKLISPATAATGILNWGGPFLRACFFLRFEDQKRHPSLSYCFAPISIALRPLRPASKPASKPARSVLFQFPWSRETGVRDLHWSLPLTLFHPIIFWFCCNFPYPWSFEACLEAVPLRQLRPKILARQHSYQLFQVQPCWDFNNSII